MAVFEDQEKPGSEGDGWDYNENLIEYNDTVDPDTGFVVLYNSLGTSINWTFQVHS